MSRRYYGNKKIETAQEDGEFVILSLDKESLRIPTKLFEASVSKEPLNLTDLWERQLTPICKETLELWLSWDITWEQIQYLSNLLKTSLEYNLKKAREKQMGKSYEEMRLSDVDKILKEDE